jgi:hypothetical protein
MQKQKQQEQSEPKIIPKEIHFIWAGGEKLMPHENRAVVIQWLRKHSMFTIRIWVKGQVWDKHHPKQGIEQLKQEYLTLFRAQGLTPEECARIEFMDIREIPELAEIEESVELARLFEPDNYVVDEYPTNGEMNRLRPNYGGSSDFLRYLICYHFGGAYFDTDVAPGQYALDKTIPFGVVHTHQLYQLVESTPQPDESTQPHQLYVDHLSQEERCTQTQLSTFALYLRHLKIQVGNDTLVCSKHNPLMWQFYKESVASYHLDNMDEPMKKHLQLISTYNADDIQETTIFRTGPRCMLRTLKRYIPANDTHPVKTITVAGQSVQVKPVRCSAYQLTQPLPNKQDWLKVPLIQSPSLNAAISLVIRTVVFEYQYFKIIRLDDHINDILDSTAHLHLKLDENQIAESLIERLHRIGLDYSQIQMAQLSFDRPPVIRFYKQHHLQDKYHSHYYDPDFSMILLFYRMHKMALLKNVVDAVQNGKSLKGRFKDPATLMELTKNMSQFHRFVHIRLENLYQDLTRQQLQGGLQILQRSIEDITISLKNCLTAIPHLNRYLRTTSLLNLQAFQKTLDQSQQINTLLATPQKREGLGHNNVSY